MKILYYQFTRSKGMPVILCVHGTFEQGYDLSNKALEGVTR